MILASIKISRKRSGFTLFEIILALVAIGFLGVIFSMLMDTGVTESYWPKTQADDLLEINRVAEQITADYREALKGTFSISSFKGYIESQYGTTYNLTTGFTSFICAGSDCTETGSDANVLKVTVSKGSSSVTVLFTE